MKLGVAAESCLQRCLQGPYAATAPVEFQETLQAPFVAIFGDGKTYLLFEQAAEEKSYGSNKKYTDLRRLLNLLQTD